MSRKKTHVGPFRFRFPDGAYLQPEPDNADELTRLRELAHRIGLCTCEEGRCHRSDLQCLAREALTGVKNWAPGGEP